MKRLAPTLLIALLVAACCACLPPRTLAPGMTVTPALQESPRPTVGSSPGAAPSPLPAAVPTAKPLSTPPPAATATATPRPAMPAASPTAFGLVSIPRATVVYYDVAGATAEELCAELDALRPIGRDGAHWDAVCNWTYWWSWPGGASGCDLAAASVTYEVQVTFPRWAPPEDAPPDLVARWASFVRALAEHELGHVDRAIAGVASIAEAVRGADCDTANAAAEGAVARVQEENDAYDAETDHGAAQGARFP